MKDIKWLISRLKSMNALEVMWRVQQKSLQKKEYKKFFLAHKPVTEISVSKSLYNLKPDGSRLGIKWNNQEWQLFETLDLFGIFDYQQYKRSWNDGFQTDNSWPTLEFSCAIPISQREDIGDIRINWELNRHFQFVGLAKNYYVTDEQKYLDELIDLFEDWNQNNLFLHGVQWTSEMEVAIRIVSWSYMYAFIEKADGPQELLDKIVNGIKIMADHVLAHRSRYSSANNHLIVEMLGLGVAGILLDYEIWIDYSIKVLTEELPRQNYLDGVNKEMSLHYQTFVMEAYGIMAILLRRNERSIPRLWLDYLDNMSKFVTDCCGDYEETITFGDDDEGKILDFVGKINNYYDYVLQLMGIVLSKRYTDSELEENIKWIATNDELDKYKKSKCYRPGLVSHFKQGGYTILRSKDRSVLLGIDHADLGFGSIAAHGHADALSFQLYIKGLPVFVDPGTYSYHIDKKSRDDFRKTINHNTICVDGKDQSEMVGPFLWGKKAKTKLIDYNFDACAKYIVAETNGYLKAITRKYFFKDNLLVITDVSTNSESFSNFNIGPNFKIFRVGNEQYKISGCGYELTLAFEGEKEITEVYTFYSPSYGTKEKIQALRVKMGADKLITTIRIGNIYNMTV